MRLSDLFKLSCLMLQLNQRRVSADFSIVNFHSIYLNHFNRMKQVFTAAFLLILSTLTLGAQDYETVIYNAENNDFDNGQPLPAETFFNLTSGAGSDVDLVEVEIYRNDNFNRPVYTTSWERPLGSEVGSYLIPINYKMRRSSDYSFILRYFKSVEGESRKKMKQAVFNAIDVYLDGVVNTSRNSISVDKRPRVIIDDLNAIVEEAIRYYVPKSDYEFRGFSSVIESQLQAIDQVRLRDGMYMDGEVENKDAAKQRYGRSVINDLKRSVKAEAEQVLDAEYYVLDSTTKIRDYKTENIQGSLGIDIGYGAIFLGGEVDDFSYARAPYAGLSFPLANLNIGPKFFRNASVNAGLFLRDFEDENGNIQTGPVIGLPIYAGIGYKLFRFVRINAGGVLIGDGEIDGDSFRLGNVGVKPFVGLSVELRIKAKLAE